MVDSSKDNRETFKKKNMLHTAAQHWTMLLTKNKRFLVISFLSTTTKFFFRHVHFLQLVQITKYARNTACNYGNGIFVRRNLLPKPHLTYNHKKA